MASYSLRFKRSVRKDVKSIPRPDMERILNAVDGLADNPHPPGAKPLTGRDAWRLRVGKYRVIYSVDHDNVIVEVIKIGHRGAVYR